MGCLRKTLFAVLLAGILLAYFPVAYAANIWPFEKGGVKIKITFYDENGNPYKFLGIFPKRPSNIVICYQIFFNSYYDGSVEIARGKTKSSEIFVPYEGKFREEIESWIKNKDFNGLNVGIEVNLWIVDEDSGNILQRISYWYPVNVEDIHKGVVNIIPINVMIFKNPAVNIKNVRSISQDTPMQIGYYNIVWVLKYRITPEDIAEALLSQGYSDWVKYVDGRPYIKTPLFIVENDLQYYYPWSLEGESAKLISFYEISSREETFMEASIGIGTNILDKLSKGESLSSINSEITLYKGGKTISKNIAFAGKTMEIYPGETAYFYVWTRPYFEYYEEWVITEFEYYPTGDEKFETYISDILMKDDIHIDGNWEKKEIPQEIFYQLLKSSELAYFGELPPGDVINIKDFVYTTYDTNIVESVDYGTLATAIIGMTIVTLASLGVSLPLELATIASALVVSVSYKLKGEVTITGTIENYGDGSLYGGIPDPRCYNVSEYVWYTYTTLQWRKDPPWRPPGRDPYYYSIPIAYVESK